VAIQAAVARQKNATVLDDTITTVNGLTIAGIGDPAFTPDKNVREPAPNPDGAAMDPMRHSGEDLASTIREWRKQVNIAMVHDPAMAQPLSGVVPLVLAGHRHKRAVSMLPEPKPVVADGSASPSSPTPAPSATGSPAPATPPLATRLMVEGSTGGAGLRGLENDEPTPLTLSVLYFDENHALKAYDDIALGGTGESNVQMQRRVIGAEVEPGPTSPSTPPTSGP
jgi:hypothetical protein